MALPIDAYLPDIVAQYRAAPNLVLAAAPGAGKTTRVPLALWQAGVEDGRSGAVWVMEPRRLAARLAAHHVAAAAGEPVGQRVGYRVRFDDCTGPATRLVYLTEGILWRQLLAERRLHQVDCVVFDEFHGRTLASDLALAALRHLQRTVRPDLRLVVMSATLHAEPIAALLGGAPIQRIPGRAYPVDITHLKHRDARPLEVQVAAAVAAACEHAAEGDADAAATAGDILVFLPGIAEIRRAEAACLGVARRHNLCVLPLHGGLTRAAQDRAVRPMVQRKVILSTNVAETSVTIDGVTWVIDSGLAKEASQDAWSGVARLELAPISQAAATQRAGRAGRTRPGRCVRLYTAVEAARRPAQATPEVLRLDLAEASLSLAALAVPPLGQLPCVDAPPPDSVLAAHALLVRLGAVLAATPHTAPETPLAMTPLGRRLSRIAVHPRLGRLVLQAADGGLLGLGCRAAALLSDTATLGQLLRRPQPDAVGHSDLDTYLHDVAAWPQQMQAMVQQLERQVRQVHVAKPGPQAPEAAHAFCRALLAAFPDRVARRLPPHGIHPGALPLQLAAGGQAHLSPRSQVRDSALLIAVHARETTHSTHARQIVELAEAVSPEMLVEWGGDAVRDSREVAFDAQGERVEAISRLTYDGLVLEENRQRPYAAEAGPILAKAAAAAASARGWAAFLDVDALDSLRGRLEVAAVYDAHCAALALDDAALQATLAHLCHSCLSFAEVRAQSLLQHWLAACPGPARAALDRLTPAHVTLASGRRLAIAYAPQHPPAISTWLQDFFGCTAGPLIAGGKQPLTLHLLAPNRRAVQVTQDLAGFWQRHYPDVRKQLQRRYPRHAWPDNPRTAPPPPPSARGRTQASAKRSGRRL